MATEANHADYCGKHFLIAYKSFWMKNEGGEICIKHIIGDESVSSFSSLPCPL